MIIKHPLNTNYNIINFLNIMLEITFSMNFVY